MQFNQEIVMPLMPDEIHLMGKPGKRQDGFQPTPGIPLSELTPEQAQEYAELWTKTFLAHYCKEAGIIEMPALEPPHNELLIGITPIKGLGGFDFNLEMIKRSVVDILDRLDAHQTEPGINKERCEQARLAVLSANDSIASAFAGL